MIKRLLILLLFLIKLITLWLMIISIPIVGIISLVLWIITGKEIFDRWIDMTSKFIKL